MKIWLSVTPLRCLCDGSRGEDLAERRCDRCDKAHGEDLAVDGAAGMSL